MSIKGLVIGLVIIILAYPIYLWATYINDTVTSGSGYAFKIGDTKKEVYDRLDVAFGELAGNKQGVFIQIKSNSEMEKFLATESGFDVMISPLFHNVGFVQFEKKDLWQFYIGASYFNTLKLEFCDGKLCRIHRHRQYFELP
jgi:hypothetical protein